VASFVMSSITVLDASRFALGNIKCVWSNLN